MTTTTSLEDACRVAARAYADAIDAQSKAEAAYVAARDAALVLLDARDDARDACDAAHDVAAAAYDAARGAARDSEDTDAIQDRQDRR